jgi:chemotaxis signal transduction protein
MRYLTFRIFNKAAEEAGARFVIRESQAIESVPFSGVVPGANDPEAQLGTVSYHGRPVRVFDLGAALGLGAGYLPQRVRLLIVRQSRIAVPLGIAVQPELEEVTSAEAPGMQMVDLRALGRIGKPRRIQS